MKILSKNGENKKKERKKSSIFNDDGWFSDFYFIFYRFFVCYRKLMTILCIFTLDFFIQNVCQWILREEWIRKAFLCNFSMVKEKLRCDFLSSCYLNIVLKLSLE